MRIFFLILFALIFSNGFAQKSVEASFFQEASEAYEAGEYELALEEFESLLKSEQESSTLYYNAGKAAEASEKIGLAVFYYRKALRINPALSVARNNLQMIQPKINQVDQNTTAYIFSQAFISTPQMMLLILFQLVMVGVIVLIYRLSELQKTRKDKLGGNILLCISCIVALIVGGIILIHDTMRNENIDAIVMNSTVMRQGAGSQYFEVVSLKEGTAISILQSPEGGWVRVQLVDGTVAFVKVNDLRAL